MTSIQIAIDGPASSGKSTIAKRIAKALQLVYIDTGAMYRALTLAALEKKVDVSDELALTQLLEQLTIHFEPTADGQKVYINEQEVTAAIREQAVSQNVSEVSSHEKVREQLVHLQRELAGSQPVIMDGRDIGTVVLPHATVKIFLVASVAERARRRYIENKERGIATDLEDIKASIMRRDQYDSSREHSPLKKAADAVEVDTTTLSIDEVVQKIIEIINKKVENTH